MESTPKRNGKWFSLNLKEQQYVCTLAETGNLTRAAERLFISQPALSLYIRKLENALGVELFNRAGKRFTPTAAGQVYLENARRMLELRDRFNQELSDLRDGKAHRLRVGMQSIRATALSATLILRFLEVYPDVRLIWHDEVYQELEKLLLSDQLDLFFCNKQNNHEALEYVPLYEDEILFIVSKNHPLVPRDLPPLDAEPPTIDLNLFRNERFFLNTPSQSMRHYADIMLADAGFFPEKIFILRRIYTIISLINQGAGVGFVCKQYLLTSPHHDQIAAFRVHSQPLTVPFCAIYKKSTPLSPVAIDLCNWMRDQLHSGAWI